MKESRKTVDIDRVWARIKSHQGDVFHTIGGKEFTYMVTGKVLNTSRTRYNLPKSEFAKALQHVPISGPGEITDLVRGPSYIWGILHDSRIQAGEW